MSFYFDSPEEKHIDSLKSAVRDLQLALNRGGCLILSYRSRFALAMIASLHIYNGSSVDEAIEAVSRIKKGAPELQQYRHVLNMLHALQTKPGNEGQRLEMPFASIDRTRRHRCPSGSRPPSRRSSRCGLYDSIARQPAAPAGKDRGGPQPKCPYKKIIPDIRSARDFKSRTG